MFWFQLADRQKRSVSETKSAVTATEFLRWQRYAEMEPNFFHREDYNFAILVDQLFKIRCMFSEHPPKVEVEDWLLKFKEEKKPLFQKTQPVQIEEELTVKEVEKKVTSSKMAWLGWAFANQGPAGKIKTRTPPPKPGADNGSGTPGNQVGG